MAGKCLNDVKDELGVIIGIEHELRGEEQSVLCRFW